MSRTSSLNKYNTATYSLLNDLNREVAMDIVKRLRFDYGVKKPRLYKELAIVNYLSKIESIENLRANIMNMALPNIKKL